MTTAQLDKFIMTFRKTFVIIKTAQKNKEFANIFADGPWLCGGGP